MNQTEPAQLTENFFSRLTLGTVQFGLPYGVANRTGQPGIDQVRDIVKAALDGGVTTLDTAAAYGTSEEVLGCVLHELGVTERVKVITKVRPLTPAEVADPDAAAHAITASVDTSRQRLRVECLTMVLFHREADACHLQHLETLKKKGWLRYAGVSCDNRPGPASTFTERRGVDALQLPVNILDRRHLRAGSIDAAVKNSVKLFARGAFLQGLLMMPEEHLPPVLRDVVPVRKALEGIADGAGVSMAELSLRYLLGLTGITSVLTGVETVSQIQENLEHVKRGPLSVDVMDAIDAVVPDLPETLLTPSFWPST